MKEPVAWMKIRTDADSWIPLELVVLFELTEICFLQAARRDTTACAEHWSTDDPMHGHCAAIALIVQDLYGGEILRASLEDLPRYAHMRSHYWNLLPKKAGLKSPYHRGCIDIELDLSAGQFAGNDRSLVPQGEVRPRSYLLENPDTARRYALLKKRAQGVDYWGDLLSPSCPDEMI